MCVKNARTRETHTHSGLILEISLLFLARGFARPSKIAASMFDYYTAQGVEKTPKQMRAAVTNWNPSKALERGAALEKIAAVDGVFFGALIKEMKNATTEELLQLTDAFAGIRYDAGAAIVFLFRTQAACKLFRGVCRKGDEGQGERLHAVCREYFPEYNGHTDLAVK